MSTLSVSSPDTVLSFDLFQYLIAGPNSGPFRDGFQATSLDSDEVVKVVDAMYHSAAVTGKVKAHGWLRYSGFARHKDPQLDATGSLADLLTLSI